MGEADTEIVKRMYDCFRAGDNDTPFDYYAEDVLWDARGADMPGLSQVYLGHDGIRDFWRQWLEAWDEIDFEASEPEKLPDGRIRVRVVQRNLGREAGVWIDRRPYHHFWSLVDGKITKVEMSWED